ncbi:phosphatase PAP2 family protein [Deltaproteobacteria bacterium TL4]
MNQRFRVSYGLLSILIAVVVPLILISPYDFRWTEYLSAHRWNHFAELMRRSFFEEGQWGGSDPSIVFILIILVLYFWSWSSKAPLRIQAFRPWYGYIVFTSLFAGVGMIHSLKWMIGRARPVWHFKDNILFTTWYEFGVYSFPEPRLFYSSFPSGHTAAAMVLMTLAYLCAKDPVLSRKWRIWGWLWGGLVLGFSSLMMLSRCMAEDHWLSDGIGAIGLVWLAAHYFYFYVFQVPRQRQYFSKWRRHPFTPKLWEIKLFGLSLLMIFSVVGIVWGLRAMLLQTQLWLGGATLLGIIVFGLAYQQIEALHNRFMNAYELDISSVPL